MFKGLFDFKNYFITIRWVVLAPIIIYGIIGIMALSSTSSFISFFSSTFYKQLLWVSIGSFVFLLIQFVRIQFIYDYAYVFYLLILALLLITFNSPVIEGAQRWIVFGKIYFQPSELGKIVYIIGLSRLFNDYRVKDKFSIFFIFLLLLSIIPPLIIFKQPDLGTAIIYLSLILPILYWSNFDIKLILLMIFPFVSMVASSNIVFYYIWMIFVLSYLFILNKTIIFKIFHFTINLFTSVASPYIWINILEDHHRNRITSFIDPFSDPTGNGYQVIQSMISIGSGGFWGKGLGEGTQTHLKFLPVRDTDFIVSVISEEMGFFTISIILLSLTWFVYWVVDYSQRIENNFISTLLIGLCSLIFMHVIINMGMISGLLPVTGLPVPFISYGGSFFLTCSIGVGLINNIINNHI
jgi:rod shape determining protein RodA